MTAEGDGPPREIVGVNLSESQLSRAHAAGLVSKSSQRLQSLDLDVHVFRVPNGVDPSGLVSNVSQLNGAIFDFNTEYQLAGNACEDNRCYGRTLIGWQVDDARRCGAGSVRIGMIDTRVRTLSSTLKGVDIASRSFIGDRLAAPADHGTAVAALLVGRNDGEYSGLLPRAELHAANIFHRNDKGRVVAEAEALVAALDWLLQNNVTLANMSLAGPPNKLLQIAVERAHAKGLFMIAAAGNGGSRAEAAYPAAYPEVVAVTALDRYFRPYEWANRGEYISFAAPGVNIWTPTGHNEGTIHSGTSFAAAFVSAIAADLVARQTSPDTIFRRLQALTKDLGPTGRDPIYGWGLVRSPSECQSYAAN